jgi:hypothetical protein
MHFKPPLDRTHVSVLSTAIKQKWYPAHASYKACFWIPLLLLHIHYYFDTEVPALPSIARSA